MANITKQNNNFADWYTDVCLGAKLFSYGSVKGTINYLPYGWAIWENIKSIIDAKLKETGSENVQLPIFIKTSDFAKEKEHIEGFAPEAFLVNKIGLETLSDPLIVRPTSEVLFSQLFQQEIFSYKNLPLKYNQWVSVYRAEKNTKPFLRGCEFFWHELHAVFDNQDECEKYVLEIHNLYNDFLIKQCALPILSGKKTENEKFAGAIDTYTREVFSIDGQCIQTGTSHFLGTSFSEMYDIKFQAKDNTFKHPYYMSAGITTRLIGDLIVVHGDDKGIVMPFDISPIQIQILTLFADKDQRVLAKANEIKELLNQYRVNINSKDESFGFKANEWEIKGIPFALVIGPKDLEQNTLTIIRRDLGTKTICNLNDLSPTIANFKVEYYNNLYNKANKHLNDSIVEINSIDELDTVIKSGKIGLAYWCGEAELEKTIKEKTSAAPRCVKEDNLNDDNLKCFLTNKKAKQRIYIARSY